MPAPTKGTDHARLYNEDRRRIRALNSERLTNA